MQRLEEALEDSASTDVSPAPEDELDDSDASDIPTQHAWGFATSEEEKMDAVPTGPSLRI